MKRTLWIVVGLVLIALIVFAVLNIHGGGTGPGDGY